MGIVSTTLKNLHKRRENQLQGKVNCIPSPIKALTSDFPGIEQEEYIIVTGAQKTAKSQFTSWMFIYTPILYAYEHPDKIRVKIFYAPLEESKEKVVMRFMRYLMFMKSNRTLRVSHHELNSTIEGKPVSEEVLDLLESEEYQKILKFFEDHITFIDSANPTGIYKTLVKYADEHGKREYNEVVTTDEFGEKKIIKTFKSYTPNDPDEYVIIITDHLGLIQEESGKDKRNTIKKWSEYCMELRDKYRYIPVNVQQQSTETLDKEAFKLNKIRPTPAGLADCKDTRYDCNIMIGLTNPYAMDVKNYLGYDITRLKDHQRFIEIMLSRDGTANSVKAMYFDGAVSFFTELKNPSSEDYDVFMEKVYALIDRLKQQTRQAVSMLSFRKKRKTNSDIQG